MATNAWAYPVALEIRCNDTQIKKGLKAAIVFHNQHQRCSVLKYESDGYLYMINNEGTFKINMTKV